MNTEQQILPHVRLQFHIQHPSLDDCWSEGYEYASTNMPEGDNPYKAGTSEHEYWQQGWWAGFYGEQPLFNTGGDLGDNSNVVDIRDYKAANAPDYEPSNVRRWAGRVAKIAGVIAITVAAVELIDLAS